MIRNLDKVNNKLYRGSAPSPKEVKWLKDRLGIKKIVSLDKDAGERIHRVCKLLGIDHVMFPLEMDRKSILKLLNQNLHDLLIKGGPTFVHCKFGKDRTGLVVAMYKCKYMNMKPEAAIEEAMSFGFGIGVDPKVVDLYKKIIKSCQPMKDENAADIVSNTREYISDNRTGILDEAHQGSFAPFLDETRQYPMDSVDNFINDQSPTRQNYQNYKSIKEHDKEETAGKIPPVGQYNNDAGVQGFGPVLNPGGFIYD
jgi:hypothetical protein